MQLTPAYLTAVATFYDMFSTVPKPRNDVFVCTNISCSLLGADEFFEAMLAAADGDPDVGVRSFECLGACDIAPMASVNGEYVGPLDLDDAARIVEDLDAGRAVLEHKQLRYRRLRPDPGRPPPHELNEDPVRPHRRAGAEHAPGLRAPRRLPVAAQGADDDPEEVLERLRLGHPRPRRRRLPDRPQDLVPAPRRHGQVPRLQRRRVRAGHVQGPRADAEEPAHADRGDRHRRLRGPGSPRLHLHPRRVRATRPTSSRPRSPRRARPGTSASGSSARTTRCRSCSTAAPAPTSAARRPGCSTRSRASAATRA